MALTLHTHGGVITVAIKKFCRQEMNVALDDIEIGMSFKCAVFGVVVLMRIIGDTAGNSLVRVCTR